MLLCTLFLFDSSIHPNIFCILIVTSKQVYNGGKRGLIVTKKEHDSVSLLLLSLSLLFPTLQQQFRILRQKPLTHFQP